jgi:hypothetical protein
MIRTLIASLVLASLAGCADDDTVRVTVNGHGRVRSNPAGIDCSDVGGRCEEVLGLQFVLVAEPATGMRFSGWSGDGPCNGASRATLVVYDEPEEGFACTASFVPEEAAPQQ